MREGVATKWDRRMLDGNFKINLGKAERLYLKVRGGGAEAKLICRLFACLWGKLKDIKG